MHLALLARNGLLAPAGGVGVKAAEKDIAANPKNLTFAALEAAQLSRSLDGTSISVLVVVRRGEEGVERIVKLEKLLHSAEVKKFIGDEYQGSVLPAF